MDIITAWRTHAEWRDDFLASATRELSKHGSLDSHAHDYRELSAGLTAAEVVALYELLRQSRRPESEWRREFLVLFPQVSPTELPAPLKDEAEELREADVARKESLGIFGPPGPTVADEDIPF